jgi:hypothetical protein
MEAHISFLSLFPRSYLLAKAGHIHTSLCVELRVAKADSIHGSFSVSRTHAGPEQERGGGGGEVAPQRGWSTSR